MSDFAAMEPVPPFQVLSASAGTVVYPPQGRFGPRMQPNLQLVLLHTGQMTVAIDGRQRVVPAGHAALLTPGHREEFVFAADQSTWHRWIHVDAGTLEPQAARFWESLPAYIPLSEQMNRLTDLMLELQGSDREHNREVLMTLGRAALLLYCSECRARNAGKSVHPSVLMTKSLIRQSYPEDLSLAHLAKAAGVTPEHLIRLFRRHEGATPMQYLWTYRIERGLHLLRNTGLSVGEIAERCGFKTSYHFARLVKRHTRLTPTEVRQQSWHGPDAK